MKKMLLIVIALAAIFMCCCNQNRSANLHLNNQYLVGGGFHVYYKAPVDGTAILIDASSGKHIATETLSVGETFEMDLPIDDPEELETLNAVLDVKNLDPRLYFVPIEKQVPEAK